MVADAARNADFWIQHLGLQSHPEGGYFKETFRSKVELADVCLGSSYVGPRPASTAIYFLVSADQPSRLHRLQTEELWHFYAGDTLEITVIDVEGKLSHHLLGNDLAQGASFQVLVPAGVWFGASVAAGGAFALCGCTMAPGFDFADFELGTRGNLLTMYPQLASTILALT